MTVFIHNTHTHARMLARTRGQTESMLKEAGMVVTLVGREGCNWKETEGYFVRGAGKILLCSVCEN